MIPADILNKLKKNGILRVFKIMLSSVAGRIRGYCFGFINSKHWRPKGLVVHSGVTSQSRYLEIGENVSIGRNCSFGGLGRIILSSRVVLNRDTHLDSACLIEIGENTLVGPDCYFVDSNHIPTVSDELISSVIESQSIVVGKNVWLGRGVTVLCGVKIGDNSVIGAGSVVTNEIPPSVIAAGVPARILKVIGEGK